MSKRPRVADDDPVHTSSNMAKLFLNHFSNRVQPDYSRSVELPYSVITSALADVSCVGSRLESTKFLSTMFFDILSSKPSSIITAMYLVMNCIAPAHEGVELGVGDALLMKVVADSSGMTEKHLKEEYHKTGDLAEIAQQRKRTQQTLVKPKELTAEKVLKCFRNIAMMTGKDVTQRRSDVIKALLRDAKGAEVNFIVRALQGKMRIGVAENTVLCSLGYALALLESKSRLGNVLVDDLQELLDRGAETLTRVFRAIPHVDIVMAAFLENGFAALDTLNIRPGIPVKPQLAHPTKGITAILDRFQDKDFTCEYKYDGERAQIHYCSGVFHIYSRNSECHTTKYPDLIALMPSTFGVAVDSFIIDSEVVAVDNGGKLLPFQTLQHRGRKNIDIGDVVVNVAVFAFDILFLNGCSLMELPLVERRGILRQKFVSNPGKFQFAQSIDSTNTEEIQSFLNQSLLDGCEGLMIKTLHEAAKYCPAKRSHSWLKLKKDYMSGIGDTLDLVPIGAYFGKGKRTGVFGGFLLACYNHFAEEFQSICKIGTGFQDAILEKLTEQLSKHTVDVMPSYYRTNDKPDVWLTESCVWEVKAADLSISPNHCAAMGLVDKQKGIALRFPRFIRERSDKNPTSATTAEQVASMYLQQSLIVSVLEPSVDEE